MPTNSGRTVERRDQVFMTFRLLVSWDSCTFFNKGSSTKGPFFNERATTTPHFNCGFRIADCGINATFYSDYLFRNPKSEIGCYCVFLFLTINRSLAFFFRVLIPLGRDPPGSYRMASPGRLSLSSAMGMIHRIHGHTSRPWVFSPTSGFGRPCLMRPSPVKRCPHCPIVARQVNKTLRTSPEGILI